MGPVSEKRQLRGLPPLQSGDRLTGAEFERRQAAMGGDVRAELIDGVVYMGPPVSVEHATPHVDLIYWLRTYALSTQGVQVATDATLRLDETGRPQPDASLWIVPEAGGRVRYDPDKVLRGTVELAVEVAASTAAYDLHQKKAVYARHGLPEYLVYVVHSQELRWWLNEEGEFVPNPADERGVARSRVFPGLWLDAAAFLRGDMVAVLETLRLGLATKEHADFSEQLHRKLSRSDERNA